MFANLLRCIRKTPPARPAVDNRGDPVGLYRLTVSARTGEWGAGTVNYPWDETPIAPLPGGQIVRGQVAAGVAGSKAARAEIEESVLRAGWRVSRWDAGGGYPDGCDGAIIVPA